MDILTMARCGEMHMCGNEQLVHTYAIVKVKGPEKH